MPSILFLLPTILFSALCRQNSWAVLSETRSPTALPTRPSARGTLPAIHRAWLSRLRVRPHRLSLFGREELLARPRLRPLSLLDVQTALLRHRADRLDTRPRGSYLSYD